MPPRVCGASPLRPRVTHFRSHPVRIYAYFAAAATMRRLFPLPFLLLTAGVATPTHAVPDLTPAGFARTVKPLFEEHCFGCHGDGEHKGNLALDKLTLDFSTPEKLRSWIDVFDNLDSGEMPPKKKPRPPVAAKAAASEWLRAALVAADGQRLKSSGRTVLRRLNRTEFENTIHDLLGATVEIKELLPEDASAQGFDNIGSALNVSSVLMDRYLEAIDVVLDQVLTNGPRPETKTTQYTIMPQRLRTDLGPGKKDFRLGGIRPMGEPGKETVVFFNSSSQPVTLELFKAPVEGTYRFRVHTTAYQSQGKKLTVAWYGGTFGGIAVSTHLIGHYDIAPEGPTMIEFEDYLPIKGTIRPQPYRLGQRAVPEPETYPGPGVSVEWVEVEGPILATWPPIGYQNLLGTVDLAKGTQADAEKALRWLIPRAFRRPVPDAEIAPYIDLVKAQLDAGKPFTDAFRTGVKAVLTSPDFLFLKESPGALSDDALASRLSYFLWSSMPDDALRKAAETHTLRRPEVLRAQVERMLQDPRAKRFTEDFTGQWLGLRSIENTTPDKKLYPEHDDALQDAMVKETHLFFDELLKNDLSVSNFVDSKFAMLNERLAQHYGVDGVEGQAFRKVNLPPESHRGGVLTQASILKVTANGTSTSPVIRGNWVLRNILGKPVKPPPPNVPAIEPDIRGAKTIREQLTKHREQETCASCHNRMDPPGLALESYDVIGGWRTNYRSLGEGQQIKTEVEGRRVQYRIAQPVDPSGVLTDGTAFANLDEFKKTLLADRAQLARCVTEKLLVYATGAGLEFADRPAVEAIVKQSAAKDYGLRTIIHSVVQSSTFLNK